MTGIEIAVGAYLFAWAKRRAKPLAERAGKEADAAAELLMDRLHTVVEEKLGSASQGLERLAREAAEDLPEPSATTSSLVNASLAAAMEDDPAFAEALRKAVGELDAVRNDGGGGGAQVNDFRYGTFSGPVQGSGTQNNHLR
jgi:hypothetical protein